jgi:hypothetical protein
MKQSSPSSAPVLTAQAISKAKQRAATEIQPKPVEQIRQFGHGRPLISTELHGHRFVAVGNRRYSSEKWKTFHDFLVDYMKIVLGNEWGTKEEQKPFGEQHPILQWYQAVRDFQARTVMEVGKVFSAVFTGPTMAYAALAYDLYTLAHHELLQQHMIKRLQNRTNFQGARYETFVTAAFIRAGFDVELENERDPSSTHCEFTATHRLTGQKFSVEAKSRHRTGFLGQEGAPPALEKIQADVFRLLQAALQKNAMYERIIFIDVNVPPEDATLFETQWFKKVTDQLNRLEATQRPYAPWPQSFVIFTNHPYHYAGTDETYPAGAIIFTAINNQDFRGMHPDLLRQKYPILFQLVDSIIAHTTIPHTFEQ